MKQKPKSIVIAEFLLKETDNALCKGVWPFVESPGEVTRRIAQLLDGHYPRSQVEGMCEGLERALLNYCTMVHFEGGAK